MGLHKSKQTDENKFLRLRNPYDCRWFLSLAQKLVLFGHFTTLTRRNHHYSHPARLITLPPRQHLRLWTGLPIILHTRHLINPPSNPAHTTLDNPPTQPAHTTLDGPPSTYTLHTPKSRSYMFFINQFHLNLIYVLCKQWCLF